MYPEIICHIMCSADGKILVNRWTDPFAASSKGELMGIYASVGRSLKTDAWMFGKATLCEGYFPKKFHVKDKTPLADPQDYVSSQTTERLFVVADPDADILYESSTVRGDRIAVILPETAPAEYLEYLRKKDISYLFAGHDGYNLSLAMQTLAEKFDVRSLSLQGGGIINGAFLKAGLIDRLSVIIYPGIDGCASSTSIFHYTGKGNPAGGQTLALLSVQTFAGGVVWLNYKVHHGS